MSRLVVLVEGFDDRAFFAGWLEVRHRLRPVRSRAGLAPDEFAFTRSHQPTPCASIRAYQRPGAGRLETFLRELVSKVDGPTDFVVIWDDDGEGEPKLSAAGDAQKLGELLRAAIDDPARLGPPQPDGSREITGAAHDVRAYGFGLRYPEPMAHLPKKQALERVVLAAWAANGADAHLEDVAAWLDQPPLPDPNRVKRHKSMAGAFWAKWHAHHGWGDFYREVWREEARADWLAATLRPIDDVFRRWASGTAPLTPPG